MIVSKQELMDQKRRVLMVKGTYLLILICTGFNLYLAVKGHSPYLNLISSIVFGLMLYRLYERISIEKSVLNIKRQLYEEGLAEEAEDRSGDSVS
jgi:hypothetical protein